MGVPVNPTPPTSASLRIGVVGVGKISEQYFAAFSALPNLELVAVADLDTARAGAVAQERGAIAMGVDELLQHPSVDAVLNLTIPAAHVEVGTQAIEAGKHVYAEKPLALTPDDAAGMLRLARERGVRVGSAPDTVLGTGLQTARAVLDAGEIGVPVASAAFWASPGHELWHPSPAFYYQLGAGPLFDMGPYYLTALVSLLGAVTEVSGATTRSTRERTVVTGPLTGSALPVEVETHVSAVLRHSSGLSSTITMSFEVWGSRMPAIEVFGTTGTLSVPDPNLFTAPVEVLRAGDERWVVEEPRGGYADAGRGVGLADMARAIETGRPHRASGELAFHVLEVMDAVLRAGRARAVVAVESRVARPEPVPPGTAPHSW